MNLIYDYWFNQFNFPDKTGKPYKLNQGKMIWNEQFQAKIPQGWEVKALSQILIKNTKKFNYSSIKPTIDLSIMSSDSIVISKMNWSNNFSTNLFEMKKGDILFGSIRPYLHKAGFAPYDGVVAGTVHSFKTINTYDYNFSLITMSRPNFFNYAVSVSKGTKMPVVSSDSILDFKVCYDKKIVDKFNNISFIDILSNNIMENQKLIKIRDTLIPLLMNNQVSID
uniref:Type I restriction modification DNA specificity domain protein n=1 Tax=Mycoplasma feriruminatoris TaxID=1179777 RepID=A0A654IMT0_9MOLU|nr:hypothetical protein MF5582_00327 [Mycoplasma feriruminatoris]